MYSITIRPDTFRLTPDLKNQNPYIDVKNSTNLKKSYRQHEELTSLLKPNVTYSVAKKGDVPDLVFCANAGLALPRLPEPFVIVSYMKYPQRKAEREYIEDILRERGIKSVRFPGTQDAPFEGQAEAKWFDGGQLLVCGYGYRATKESIKILRSILKEIYDSYGVAPPRVVSFQIQSPLYYHLDFAMLVFSPTECIVQKGAFASQDITRLRQELGDRNVYVLESSDPFCLNSVVQDDTLLTHKLMEEDLDERLEKITGLTVRQIDISEFEKSGGSVACMIFTIYDRQHIKRKRSSTNLSQQAPSSPR